MNNLKNLEKMKSVVTSMNINSPVEKVWEQISSGSGLNKWFPVIAICELLGSGPGAKRVCTTIQGNELKETILTVDHQSKLFQYSIDEQNMMPTANVIGTIHITEISKNVTNVTWIANFHLLDDTMELAVLKGIDELYQAGIKGLETYIKNN
jgi:hypothetical protein